MTERETGEGRAENFDMQYDLEEFLLMKKSRGHNAAIAASKVTLEGVRELASKVQMSCYLDRKRGRYVFIIGPLFPITNAEKFEMVYNNA